ncbi:hypothetical protein MRX96_030212 [Rhipicephalus microplus]
MPTIFEVTVTGRQEPRNDEGRNVVSQPSKDGGESSHAAQGSPVSKRKLAKTEYRREYCEHKKQLIAIGLLDPEEEYPGLPSHAVFMRACPQQGANLVSTSQRPQKRRRESVRFPRGVETANQMRQRRQRQKRRGQRCDPEGAIDTAAARETTRGSRAEELLHEGGDDASPTEYL